jgi:hypothetical protein
MTVLLTRRLLIGVLALFLTLPLIAQDKDKDKPKTKDETGKKDDPKTPAPKPADTPKPAPTAGGDKANLAWKFEKGKTFYQEMTTDTTQNMKVMGQDVTQKQSQTFYFAWTPTEEKDGVWTVTQKIDGIKMTITINDQTISFDSTNPTAAANNALAEFFKQLVGSTFTLTIGKDMKVMKVEGRDEFIKKLGSANSQMEPLLKKILSDDALKQMADPTFGVVPGKEVTKGETWTPKSSELNLGPIGTYTNAYKYTYEGKDGDLQKVKVENTLTYKPPTEGGEGLPFRIKSANLTSKDAGGTIYFNPAKGRLEKSNLSLKLEGSLDIEIGGTTTKVDLKQEQKTAILTSDTSPIKK